MKVNIEEALPTYTVRFPILLSIESLLAVLRSEVRRFLNTNGHQMTVFAAGVSRCLKCKAEVEVFRLHTFPGKAHGLGYRGEALQKNCQGEIVDTDIIERVPERLRPSGWRST